MSKLNVLFASAEVTPIAKVGGLADVVGALPKALRGHGVDVRIIMPLYEVIDQQRFPLTPVIEEIPVPLGDGVENVSVYQATLPNSDVPVYLIKSPRFFGQGSIYFEKTPIVEGISEIHRFTFFSKAVVAVMPYLKWQATILHCHDWHTGLLPLFAELSNDPYWKKIQTVYTIHNMGIFGSWSSAEILRFFGLTAKMHPSLGRINSRGDIALLEQGIIAADEVTTVSPGYAKEILTPEFGLGLEAELQKRFDEGKLVGILNGIDTEHFDPTTDAALAQPYDSARLERKAANKKVLQQWADFETRTDVPLFGFVGRLFEQKGFDLIPPALTEALATGAQCVVLGSGLNQYEDAAKKLEKDFPGQVKVEIGFNADLAQQIYAGSDLFLMPSRFEPCGLGQMIAMRYGTPPIVRATGGLKDTVRDGVTGFVFNEPTTEALRAAIQHACNVFADKKAWQQIVVTGMKTDFSWDHSSTEYLKLYQSLVQ